MNRATKAAALNRAEARAPRAAGWFFAFVLCAMIVGNIAAFRYLQAQPEDQSKATQGVVDQSPRRAPGFRLRLREQTSLTDIADMSGPFTRKSAVAYYTRKHRYRVQGALSGHEIVVATETFLSDEAWRYGVLARLTYEPRERVLRAGAGVSLKSSARGRAWIGGQRFFFLFDLDDKSALLPGERVHIYPDPEKDGSYFVVAESELGLLTEWLE